jgi:maltose O-acetyltransferase
LRVAGGAVGRLVIVGKCRFIGSPSLLSMGDGVALGRCRIELHDRVSIGHRVVINDGAILLTASHSLTDPGWRREAAPISVGDNAWIATGAMLLPGVRVGRGAVIGAGAVVREDVPDFALAVGNPATTRLGARVSEYDYSPTALVAVYEAWLGPGHSAPAEQQV